ncbi:hypothetical protein BDV93DRAFT_65242 [Ceratobasidium sp. AG-I]|nr:hypothetical protein BDV93DRAFT_65242 [Ceratobasidium sp. AG-I]
MLVTANPPRKNDFLLLALPQVALQITVRELRREYNMPAVITHMHCPFCYRYISRKTSRRHSRVGCDVAQREALQSNTTLQRLLNPDMTAAPARPRRRRKYHRRNLPPPSRPAATQSASEQPRSPRPLEQQASADPRWFSQIPLRMSSKLSSMTHLGSSIPSSTLRGLGRRDRPINILNITLCLVARIDLGHSSLIESFLDTVTPKNLSSSTPNSYKICLLIQRTPLAASVLLSLL